MGAAMHAIHDASAQTDLANHLLTPAATGACVDGAGVYPAFLNFALGRPSGVMAGAWVDHQQSACKVTKLSRG
jgi:hypothetical protein